MLQPLLYLAKRLQHRQNLMNISTTQGNKKYTSQGQASAECVCQDVCELQVGEQAGLTRAKVNINLILHRIR